MSQVAYYPFDDDTAKDRSGANNNGINTFVTFAAGQFGQGAVFNGSSSFVDCGSKLVGSGPVTICGWFKPTSLVRMEAISQDGGNAGDFRMRIPAFGSGTIRFRRWTGVGTNTKRWTSVLAISASVFNFVGMVYDGTDNLRFYINGSTEILGAISTTATIQPDANLRLGVSGGDFYSGMQDEIRIYNKALTLSELDLLFHHNYLKVLALSI